MANQRTTISDEILFKSLKCGNDTALKLIYDRYWKRLYTYANKILEDTFVCEDIIQEIFISLWDRALTTDIQNLEAYLFRALKYKIANRLRDGKFSSFQERVIKEIPDQDSVESTVEYQDLEKQVIEVLDKLPKKCRNVFYLSRIQDYNNQEIADELNISIRTVETHISNGLKHFRIHLFKGILQVLSILIFLN
jgi:RNA polymerase sigma-70 factor (ECF subfamily)